MGILVNGEWHKGDNHKTEETTGKFERKDSTFRNWVTADGSPGPSGVGGFKAEPGRYHLYVVTACPWAHRSLIGRHLKGLEEVVSVSRLIPEMTENGWCFAAPGAEPRAEPDPLYGSSYIYEIYLRADPTCSARPTVPVLWDKQTETIVNNESSEILRMFNSAFNDYAGNPNLDLYPEDLRKQIDEINEEIYTNVNNGVYRCGFATTQEAYDEAVTALFTTLDKLEQRLDSQRYIAGDRLTEADWRLYTTLLRFDVAYFSFFKCNVRRIADYPNLSNYLRELYQYEGIAEQLDLEDAKRQYYSLERAWYGRPAIVPRGPVQDLTTPHNRARLPAAA
jgi:putative glutathione S-transferase